MKPIVKSLLLAFAVVGVVNAQGQPEFEVATVKLSAPVQPGVPLAITLGAVRNGVVTLRNTNLSECIQFAYGIASDTQIVGISPNRISLEHAAKACSSAGSDTRTGGESSTRTPLHQACDWL